MRGRSNENKTEHRFIFRSKWTGSGPYSPRAGRVDGVRGGTGGRVGPRWSLGGSGPLGAVGGRAGGEGGREEGEKGCLSQPTGVRYHSWPNPLVQYCTVSSAQLSPYSTQHSPNCDHVVIWNFTLDLLLLNLSLIHCVCNFFLIFGAFCA